MLQVATAAVDPGLIEFVLTVVAGYLIAGLVLGLMGLAVLIYVFHSLRGNR